MLFGVFKQVSRAEFSITYNQKCPNLHRLPQQRAAVAGEPERGTTQEKEE